MINATVHIGNYNNTIKLKVLDDNAAIDQAVVTRTQLRLIKSGGAPALTIDTNTPEHAGLFAWEAGGVLIMKLGGTPNLTKGKWAGHLVVFDAVNTDGIVWDDLIIIKAVEI